MSTLVKPNVHRSSSRKTISLGSERSPIVTDWIRQFGTPGDDSFGKISVDKAGNVYVAGGTSGPLGATNAGNYDAFVTKYDNNQSSRVETIMTTNQPPTIEQRLSRLENFFANVGEKVVEHDGNIDVLVANIQELKESVRTLTEETTRNINNLAEQAAQDRQQAAIDRQEFRRQMEQRERETRQIWEYLRNRNGGSNPPQ